MEAMNQLQAKLHRAQAEIEESLGHLAEQRAFIANRLAEGADVTQSCNLLVNLEDTHFLHVQHRDRLRRKLDGALAGKNRRMIG